MANVSQEMVKEAGVNIDELIELLVKNAGAELTTYYYTMLRFNLIDLEGDGVHESRLSEFLGEGPSGHFLRRGETSPFVSKFLR